MSPPSRPLFPVSFELFFSPVNSQNSWIEHICREQKPAQSNINKLLIKTVKNKCWVFSTIHIMLKSYILTFACLLAFNLALICVRFYPLLPQEKQRGSLRVYIQEAPWILLALAEFFNIGIAVGLKIPLTLDVQRLLIPPMMIDEVDNLPQFKYVTPPSHRKTILCIVSN